MCFEVGRRRERPAEIALLLGLTRIGVILVGVGAVLLLGFGLWLVHLGHFGYDAGWVDAAIVLYFAALALGAVGGQRPKQARRLAASLAERDARSATSCAPCSTIASHAPRTTPRCWWYSRSSC